MSCDTLNQAALNLTVSVARLPEGYCPDSMQDLADAIGARLIISPNSDFNTFAIGSTAPTTNVGPWLKDCEQWFVFDDDTASYIPTLKGGFDNQSYVVASGTFTVPDFIYKLKITAFGAGGGGFADGTATPQAGGGGGASGVSIVTVTPGQAIPYTIGSGGAGGNPGGAGGATTLLGLSAGGGAGATAVTAAGLGGTASGFDINLTGQAGCGSSGGGTVNDTQGGDAGGWGGKGGTVRAAASATGRNGLAPGGGGSGGANGAVVTAGDGAGGSILFEW